MDALECVKLGPQNLVIGPQVIQLDVYTFQSFVYFHGYLHVCASQNAYAKPEGVTLRSSLVLSDLPPRLAHIHEPRLPPRSMNTGSTGALRSFGLKSPHRHVFFV